MERRLESEMEELSLEEKKSYVIAALKSIYDPEMPCNIYDLGLIYQLDIDEEGRVYILMTLTSPNCPVSEDLFETVQERVMRFGKGVTEVKVELTWDPPWDYSMMSEMAKLQLNMFF